MGAIRDMRLNYGETDLYKERGVYLIVLADQLDVLSLLFSICIFNRAPRELPSRHR